MSNFDFGGSGPGPGTPPPPVAHQYAQPAPPPPPQFQPNPAPGAGQPERSQGGGSGGILPVGLVSLLVLLLVMGFIAVRGNRIAPFSSQIDSGWRNVGGTGGELTDHLRGEGYTCSDQGLRLDFQYYRVCAKYTKDESTAIEFLGAPDGDIQLGIATFGNVTAARAATERLIDATFRDTQARQASRGALGANAPARGAWGSAEQRTSTAFTVQKPWGALADLDRRTIETTPADVGAQAVGAGYVCRPGESGNSVNCTLNAAGGSWQLVATEVAPKRVLVGLNGRVTDDKQFDPAKELERLLPSTPGRGAVLGYVSTADQKAGASGFAGGIRVDYRVTLTGDKKARSAASITVG
ncbi:hypothetical protein HJ590_14380 [Naumannella sp. ID2617S]|nr:hypothetical protein [Naumannella sp. ID2617S]